MKCLILLLLALLQAQAPLAQNIDQPKIVWEVMEHPGAEDATLSHSGTLLAFVNYSHIYLWDISVGKVSRTFELAEHYFDHIAFSPSDSELILAGHIFSIRVQQAPASKAGASAVTAHRFQTTKILWDTTTSARDSILSAFG